MTTVWPLNPKQARFVAEYLVDLNATQAAIRAGYSPKTAGSQAFDLLKKPEIAAAVQAQVKRSLESAELTATRVLEEYRRLAFVDVRGFWHEDGRVKKISELTAEQGSVLAGFEVLIKNAQAGDGVTDTIHKFKLWDKTRALEALAKHFKLLTDIVQVEGLDAKVAELMRGRERAAARNRSRK